MTPRQRGGGIVGSTETGRWNCPCPDLGDRYSWRLGIDSKGIKEYCFQNFFGIRGLSTNGILGLTQRAASFFKSAVIEQVAQFVFHQLHFPLVNLTVISIYPPHKDRSKLLLGQRSIHGLGDDAGDFCTCQYSVLRR